MTATMMGSELVSQLRRAAFFTAAAAIIIGTPLVSENRDLVLQQASAYVPAIQSANASDNRGVRNAAAWIDASWKREEQRRLECTPGCFPVAQASQTVR